MKSLPASPTEPRVAFSVSIYNMSCIVFATTAAKARWIAVKSYRAAGYGTRGDWPRPHSVRKPTFDKSPLRNEPPQAFQEQYVASTWTP